MTLLYGGAINGYFSMTRPHSEDHDSRTRLTNSKTLLGAAGAASAAGAAGVASPALCT